MKAGFKPRSVALEADILPPGQRGSVRRWDSNPGLLH